MQQVSEFKNEGIQILVVVDMQNDFVTGSLANPAAEAIVQPIADYVAEARKNGSIIAWTLDTHDDEYMASQEGKNLPIPHCLKGKKGHDLAKPLQIQEGDLVFEKPSFGSLELGKKLATLAKQNPQKPLEVEFVGPCTDICVVSNVLLVKAFVPEAVVSVHANLCAGLTPQKHQAALDIMESCQVKILNTT